MSAQEQVLGVMLRRSTMTVPEGTPIIPDGPVATSQDMQEFKRLCELCRYMVIFGAPDGRTSQSQMTVKVSGHASVGLLTDEFLHVWNNTDERRGKFFPDPEQGKTHRFLRTLGAKSGTSDDRHLHQMEIANFAYCVKAGGASIPVFVWRTFRAL
jgi:hypothetical protein